MKRKNPLTNLTEPQIPSKEQKIKIRRKRSKNLNENLNWMNSERWTVYAIHGSIHE